MHPQHPHGQGHPHGATHAHGGQGGPNWEALYSEKSVESLPWYYPHLEPEIKERLDNLSPQAHILDIGAGPGTQAIEMAKLGYNVTATDISKAAMEKARLRAAEEGVRLEFLQDDILDSKLIGEYEVILDRGCDRFYRRSQNRQSMAGFNGRHASWGRGSLDTCFPYGNPES